jgi:hypothetical protein
MTTRQSPAEESAMRISFRSLRCFAGLLCCGALGVAQAATSKASGGSVTLSLEDDDQVIITQEGEGEIRVTGLDGTKVDGEDFVVLPLTKNLTLRGDKKASVSVAMDAVTVPGALAFQADGQENHLGIASSAIAGKVQFTGKAGTNHLAITDTTVGRDVQVNCGKDDDMVVVTDSTIEGSLKSDTGFGDDNVQLTSVSVQGSVSLKGNKGDDTLVIAGTPTVPVIGKNLAVDGGQDADTVVIENAIVHGGVSLKKQIGDSEMRLQNVMVDGKTQVTQAKGEHLLELRDSHFAGAFSSKSGPGDLELVLDGNTFHDTAKLAQTGAKPQEGTLATVTDNVFHDKVTMQTGNGNDTVALTGNQAGSPFDLKLAKGDDEVETSNNAFNGGIKLDGGPGDDTLTQLGGDTGQFTVSNF